MDDFVPRDFDVPRRLKTPLFVLEPLGPEHDAQDYDAWTSSCEHIHATSGWQDSKWPHEMTAEENRADVQRHADDFRDRKGFTYTVLDPATRDVIGCVYIHPERDGDHDARVRSWVRANRAYLDAPLWRAVSEWLDSDWPFASVEYAARVPDSELRNAIEHDDLTRAQALIAAGEDVNTAHGDPSFSLLHHAVDVQTDDYAQNGTRPNLAMVELLLASGADVTALDATGKTPLALALLYKDMAVNYPEETEALTRLLRTP